jgi:chromosome segregation ATPase
MATPQEKAQSFVKKHAKSPEEVKEELRRMEEAKKQYTQDINELEANLRQFNETLDPIIDPTSGKPLCWLRRPSQTEWESMIPAELLKYKDLTEIPPEVMKKYSDHQFDIMALLIEKPKHDAKWWKENSNLIFQELFQIHLTEVYRKLGLMVENF